MPPSHLVSSHLISSHISSHIPPPQEVGKYAKLAGVEIPRPAVAAADPSLDPPGVGLVFLLYEDAKGAQRAKVGVFARNPPQPPYQRPQPCRTCSFLHAHFWGSRTVLARHWVVCGYVEGRV